MCIAFFPPTFKKKKVFRKLVHVFIASEEVLQCESSKAQTDIVTLIHTILYELRDGLFLYYKFTHLDSSEGSHVNLGQHECE